MPNVFHNWLDKKRILFKAGIFFKQLELALELEDQEDVSQVNRIIFCQKGMEAGQHDTRSILYVVFAIF